MRSQLNIENAKIGFRNFEGREGLYNKQGDREFAVYLSEEDAIALEKEGWNIKWPKIRPDDNDEEDTRSPFLKVSVGFDFCPATIYTVTNSANGEQNITLLRPEEAGMLDWAEIENVDLVIRPYEWTVSGKTGIKAYLKAGYFTLITDDFAKKYGI